MSVNIGENILYVSKDLQSELLQLVFTSRFTKKILEICHSRKMNDCEGSLWS